MTPDSSVFLCKTGFLNIITFNAKILPSFYSSISVQLILNAIAWQWIIFKLKKKTPKNLKQFSETHQHLDPNAIYKQFLTGIYL